MRVAALLFACWAAGAVAQTRAIPATELRSGLTFGSAELRAMQADDFANPGMLWVERGQKLWQTPAGPAGRTCASCHADPAASMKGVAARYPALDASTRRVIDLESRINACRASRQQAPRLAAESEDLLALTALVAYQSRGLPLSVTISEGTRETFEQGRGFYYAPHGQMNLSCADCHERNWGRRLLAETISQGHPNAYPAYRLEWQTMGSLGRRIRSCLFGIRAQMLPYDDPTLTALELFLAWRAAGLPIEVPGVRR
ncbi:MAG TPA: sulfur oxidation c-type cytochrome SoxA [Casimicrobiaceae bacterium]|nr:sulfur oxidation c-type cytochrome SoxA [Casimicrobiaceae bacterium]